MPSERLESLLAATPNDPWLLAGTLGVAFVLGAAHALSPGHGKTVVAAYLAGSRGRVSDAIYLGAVVTITHTASVFILGLITLYASTHIAMDRIYPVLSVASALMVTGIGLWLVWSRATGRDHGHSHSHSLSHGHDHHHHHDHDHHDHDHHHHDHGHGHGHSHTHDHGRGKLLGLGVSGGLVPCPEALVVLMLSVTMQRVALGLAILGAFTLGLAAVLIAIGVAVVLTASKARLFSGDRRWMRAVPMASALIVTAIGVVMLVHSLKG